MKLNYNYLRERKRLIPLALMGISAIFAFLIFIKTTSFFVASARAETLLRRAVSQTGPDAEALKECEAKSFAIADELKKSNLFSPQEPEHHPVSSVLGILGEEVLIEDKWYKVGDNIGEARIVSVEASQVRIEWQGRQKVFAPIDGADELTSDGARRIKRDSKTATQSPARDGWRRSQHSNGLAEMVLTGQTGNARSTTKSSKEQTAVTNKKAEKQRQAASEKEFNKISKSLTKKTPEDRNKVTVEKKKTQADNKKTREKAAPQKTKKPSQKY